MRIVYSTEKCSGIDPSRVQVESNERPIKGVGSMAKKDLERLDDQGLAAWDSHDADAFLALFAKDFVWHDWTTPDPIKTKKDARAYFNSWVTAFPDMRTKLISRVVGNDSIATEIEFYGTNTGPMSMGGVEIPPTNKSVVGRGSYIARVKDGKVVEFRSHPDAAGMMMQLGLVPPL
ncbi:MAG: ester cyclase [Actinobacteria bacterium]|nr:MAG: ester cyclase [Actinomycetota bacterium]